jgi:hypothetical protein
LSEIRATTISDTAGTGPVTLTKQSAAKAWLQHNNAHSIQDSLNFSSITDGGTGLTNDATFTSSMNNDDYSISGTVGNTTSDDGFWAVTAIATTDFNARIRTHNGNLNDGGICSLTVHGDLA